MVEIRNDARSGLKRVLVVLTLASSLLFSGIIYGWAPLALTQRDEGVYAVEGCPSEGIEDAVASPCTMRQSSRLNAIYTMGSTMIIASAMPVGMFLDFFGASYTIGFAGVLECVGLLVMAYSQDPRQGHDWFTLAYMLMGMGGAMLMMGNLHIGFLFPEHLETLLASCSCLIDAGTIVFAVYQTLYFRLGVSRIQIFSFYAFLALVISTYGGHYSPGGR